MIERTLPVFWRERRRLAFVGVLAFFAGYFFYARSGMVIHGWPIELITGFVYAAVIVPVAFVVCVLFPSLRFLLESVAITRLMLAMLVYTYPTLGAVVLGSPILTAMIVVSSAALLSRLFLHGRLIRIKPERWTDRLKSIFIWRPARISDPTPLQYRFVSWVDDTEPVRVRA